MCTVTTQKIYCECLDYPKGLATLSRYPCPNCGKPVKLIFRLTPLEEIARARNSRICIKHPIDGILQNGINVVHVPDINGDTSKDKDYKLAQDSIDTKGLAVRFKIDFNKDRTRYEEPMGFTFNDPRFRPFKPGEVVGYIRKNEFHILRCKNGYKAVNSCFYKY